MIDMNLSPGWVGRLAAAGYDAVHWSSIGNAADPDGTILAWATAHDRVVLTGDLDFGEALARSGRDRPSVVQIRSRETRPAHVGAAVIDSIRGAERELGTGALLTVAPRRTRLNPLPLKF